MPLFEHEAGVTMTAKQAVPALLGAPPFEQVAGGPAENTGTRQPPDGFTLAFVHAEGVNTELQLALVRLGAPPFEQAAGANVG